MPESLIGTGAGSRLLKLGDRPVVVADLGQDHAQIEVQLGVLGVEL